MKEFTSMAQQRRFEQLKNELQSNDDEGSEQHDEDDGQPDEYTEWQDYMGGDDWDHGQYDSCDW